MTAWGELCPSGHHSILPVPFPSSAHFQDNFREGVDYKELFAVLKKTGVRTLTPTEAYQKARKG